MCVSVSNPMHVVQTKRKGGGGKREGLEPPGGEGGWGNTFAKVANQILLYMIELEQTMFIFVIR